MDAETRGVLEQEQTSAGAGLRPIRGAVPWRAVRSHLHSHLQTVSAALPLRLGSPPGSREEAVTLAIPEGGTLHLEATWLPRRAPVVVVVHGTSGSCRDAYVLRAADALGRAGFHTVRPSLRGSGTGLGRARRLYHAALTEDLALVSRWLREARAGRHSDIGILGFSLGGHVALRFAAERGDVSGVVAVSPPVDLRVTNLHIRARRGSVFGLYERLMVNSLVTATRRLLAAHPDVPLDPRCVAQVTTIEAFDAHVTVPLHGFGDVETYYREASVSPRLTEIEVPTLVLHAADDPIVPVAPLVEAPRTRRVLVEIDEAGGHVGFVRNLEHLWRGSAAVERATAFLRAVLAIGER